MPSLLPWASMQFSQAEGGLLCLQLACARIGAVHSVVFAGFSAESLSGRMQDAQPRVLLTCSAVKRGPKAISLKVMRRLHAHPSAALPRHVLCHLRAAQDLMGAQFCISQQDPGVKT